MPHGGSRVWVILGCHCGHSMAASASGVYDIGSLRSSLTLDDMMKNLDLPNTELYNVCVIEEDLNNLRKRVE